MIKNIFVFVLFSVNILCQQGVYSPAQYFKVKYNNAGIICIDEGPHGTLQSHKFIRRLISNDTVSNLINYIIVEFVNVKYQDILDKYILGENIQPNELKLIWRNSTQAHSPLFEMPVYLELLTNIRDINSNLAAGKKIRVLAGDPEFDWGKINTINDYFKNISQRDVFPAELAIKYGIDSSKNILLIYGGEHLLKTSDEKKDSTFWTIPYYINKRYPGSVISIGICNSGKQSVNGTDVPESSILDLSDKSINNIFNQFDNYDALYYIGDSKEWRTDIPAKIEKDHWNELNRRSKIVWGEGIEENLIAK